MPLPSRRSVEPRRTDGVFRILTVCTGNVCRSPQLEQLLRHRLPAAFGVAELPDVQIASAGTRGLEGQAMDASAAAEALRLGVPDVASHVARRVREPMLRQADLILALSREHRAEVVGLEPSANRRVFTLVEFARILRALVSGEVGEPVGPLDARGIGDFLTRVVAAAGAVRGLVSPPDAQDSLDIEDPYRLAPEVYERSAQSIGSWVDAIVADLVELAISGRSPAR